MSFDDVIELAEDLVIRIRLHRENGASDAWIERWLACFPDLSQDYRNKVMALAAARHREVVLVECEWCGGTGNHELVDAPCDECKGRGEVVSREEVA